MMPVMPVPPFPPPVLDEEGNPLVGDTSRYIPDRYSSFGPDPSGPYSHAFNIVPSDTEDLPMIMNAIYTPSLGFDTGSIVVTMESGEVVMFSFPGLILPIRVRKVWARSTAFYIVGLV